VEISMTKRPILLLLTLLLAAPLVAQEPCPCPPEEPPPPPPEPLWSTKLGASYVATTGNTETTTFGSDVHAERRPDPWGVEIFASYDRAEDTGEVQSERTVAGVRGKRVVGERWDVFGEAKGEKDEFAGFDLRLVLTAGGTFHARRGPEHLLDFDLGLSWTDEDRIDPEMDVSYAGALLKLDYEWKITETATFAQKLAAYPNFEESDEWRLESSTSLEAALTGRLALRLGYEVRFHNAPIGGRDDTDTTTRMSLVLNL
jgi:putative salt-induced outer membrane protein